MNIERYLRPQISKDLKHKLVLLSGPRQVGKTTLARSFDGYYLNYDVVSDRKVIQSQKWPKDTSMLVLDELHKLPKWKNWLKGLWDSGMHQQILVTGSARLDIFRKGGDSLAGRFFHHQLHPFSVKELPQYQPNVTLRRLIERGGFPEPFLARSPEDAARWRLSHIDRIIRDDLPSIASTTGIRQIELLVELLSERVGSTISYANLARDLSVSPPTVKQWIDILELLCVIFLVRPYSKSLIRSIRKEPKIYFYDTGRVIDEGGARLENTIALHLLKRNHFLTSTKGQKCSLCYIRDKEKREIDFLTVVNNCPEFLVEAKSSDDEVSPHLQYYCKRIKALPIQLVLNLTRAEESHGIKILPAADWLAHLEA